MITRYLLPLSFVVCLSACKTGSDHPELPGPTQPYGGEPHVIPGTIEAENYDEGRPEEAYHDLDEANHGADYRGVTHVDIEKRPDASGGYGIGWTKAGEWVQYTVNVKTPGTYTVEIPVASAKEGGTFHLEFNGEDVTGPIRVPNTGSWQKLVMIRKDNIALRAGVQLMRMVMDSDGETGSVGDIDFLRFALLP
jgi:hypothetical protein